MREQAIGMIDLHVHSTYSDGTFTPEQLLERARRLGLTAFALTDHDTVDGLRALPDPVADDVVVVPGVEVSAEVSHGTLHMLGYYVDTNNHALQDILLQIRHGREVRNRHILERLNGLGVALTWDDVTRHSDAGVVGRPHFAMALEAGGYVREKSEAFERYLAKGRPAYVDRYRLSPADSIAAIRAAGGVPVLAHPFTLQLNRRALRLCVKELVSQGLEGIEVHYSEHSAERKSHYDSLVRAFDLVATGGSDFHGALNPDIEMGRGFGNLSVSDDLLDGLIKRRDRMAGL